jgi:hypothetical protein
MAEIIGLRRFASNALILLQFVDKVIVNLDQVIP